MFFTTKKWHHNVPPKFTRCMFYTNKVWVLKCGHCKNSLFVTLTPGWMYEIDEHSWIFLCIRSDWYVIIWRLYVENIYLDRRWDSGKCMIVWRIFSVSMFCVILRYIIPPIWFCRRSYHWSWLIRQKQNMGLWKNISPFSILNVVEDSRGVLFVPFSLAISSVGMLIMDLLFYHMNDRNRLIMFSVLVYNVILVYNHNG